MNVETSDWVARSVAAIRAEYEVERVGEIIRTFASNGLDLRIGDLVTDFGALRAVLSATTPTEWRRIAKLIESLLEREPLSKGARWSGERIILGTLAAELTSYAAAAERSHEA